MDGISKEAASASVSFAQLDVERPLLPRTIGQRSDFKPGEEKVHAALGTPRFVRDFSRLPAFRASVVDAALQPPDDKTNTATTMAGQQQQQAQTGAQANPPTNQSQQRATASSGTSSSSPFYVAFRNATPPAVPDNSKMFPGPAGTLSDNAGFTHAVLGGRMSLPWDSGTARADGRVPIFLQSVNIFYWLDPIEVFVSSQYKPGSCPYRVTTEHEYSHVEAFTRLFRTGRDTLLAQLGALSVPTQASPKWVDPANVTAEQAVVENALLAAVQNHRQDLKALLDADRAAKDSPSSYAAVYAKCSAKDW